MRSSPKTKDIIQPLDRPRRVEETPGLYLHVPFCATKCPYCDFYSVTDTSLTSSWLEAVRKEMTFYQDTFGAFDTLYLGGGTPTVLSDRALENLFEALHRCFDFKSDVEITVEANPDDVTREKLDLLKSLGVNRLSVGVQSFDENELGFLKRRHTAAGAEKALDLVYSSGISNFGIDLMYGLPGQTVEMWTKTLTKALSFAPNHLSCYQLTVEGGTPFGKLKAGGFLKTSDEETERAFFLSTSRFLIRRGFIHYEISNFAEDQHHVSRHNRKYWHHIPYLGLGPAAHSFRNGVRWWNHGSVAEYCRSISEGNKPVEGSETLTPEQVRLEKLYLGFRTREGIDLQAIFGDSPPRDAISRLQGSGLTTLRGNRLLPTLDGFLVADRLPLLFP